MNAEQRVEEIKDHLEGKVDEKYSDLAKELDQLKTDIEKGSYQQGNGSTFAQSLNKAIQHNAEAIKKFANGDKDRVSFQLKDMTTGSNFTGEVIPADRLGGISYDPDRSRHVRDFMPVTPTSSDLVRYVVESSYTDGVEGQVEGELKGESDAELEAKSVEVKTRATFTRLSTQMLNDTPFLQQYLRARSEGKVFEDEDQQVLYGDNTGENLQGITEVAQVYTQQLTDITTKYDVLVDAITQLEDDVAGEYSPNVIMIRPSEYYAMAIAKGDDGHYLHPAEARAGNAPIRIQGVRVVPITAMQGADFIVGDFRRGATLAQRQGMTGQFFYQDGDNVRTNRVTFRVEHRIALPITNPNAFVYGNFDAALNAS